MKKRREFLRIRREEAKQEEGAQVAIPAPDPPLPPSFDADVNTHRYRFLEAPGGWLARWALLPPFSCLGSTPRFSLCLATASQPSA